MKRRACSERGQASLIIIIFIGVFLLGATGLATDYTQIWAHRQMAQNAADAACQAGSADLYLKALDPAAEANYGVNLSWIGSSFDCGSIPGSPPCRYASLNGYSGSNVAVSFPSSVEGATPPSGFGVIPYPYIKVTITDPVSLSFTKLVSSSGTFNVSAKAECGLNPISVPIPIVILHRTASAALSVGGAATIKIFSGPNRSIQVNSTSPTAVTVGTVDLTLAGPGGTGADLAVAGGPGTKPAGVALGTSGKWVPGVIPSGDPWGPIAAPSVRRQWLPRPRRLRGIYRR
jgi:putative Flp pilus-assembly TadE/G-like protein